MCIRDRDKAAPVELAACERALAHLGTGQPARTAQWTEAEAEVLGRLLLITAKPVLYVANVGEDDPAGGSPLVATVRRHAASTGAEVVVLSAKLEQELAEMEHDDRQEFLADLGLERPGLDRLVQGAFHLLGLMTFFTAGPKEIRAWAIARPKPLGRSIATSRRTSSAPRSTRWTTSSSSRPRPPSARRGGCASRGG